MQQSTMTRQLTMKEQRSHWQKLWWMLTDWSMSGLLLPTSSTTSIIRSSMACLFWNAYSWHHCMSCTAPETVQLTALLDQDTSPHGGLMHALGSTVR